MKLQAVKGTSDILPEDQARWHDVYRTANEVLTRAGVRELSTPVFEHSEVFTRSVGDSADLVVQKEMYTFSDQGERSLTLRPEFTAGVVRAFIEHGMQMRPTPVKLWSRGPVFRAEKPQRGRYRQFHQINCEIFGLDTPLVDAEAIALLYRLLQGCGLTGMVVKLGSIGDPDDRKAYNAYLREVLAPRADQLSETSQERLRLNPLRLFDSKDPNDQALLEGLKRPLDMLGDNAKAHFGAVQGYLRDWQIPFEIDASIVRGLDYYRRTAFEVHHGSIGAQSALCGGGRYDGLVEQLGGPAVPGIGWAFGVERVLDAMREDGVASGAIARPLLFLVPMDEAAVDEVAAKALQLRETYHIEHAYVRRNPGKGLRDADRANAVFAGLRGEKERAERSYQLKHLASGEQTMVPEDELMTFLRRYV
ncbi:MAG: histidine--tRNA ligase [Trueperaceae bacterium]|nr:histidine--tRNA ligase [Trueperaceae bacterium]